MSKTTLRYAIFLLLAFFTSFLELSDAAGS